MAGSRDLYELIGTLSKSEKRYCRMMLESGAGRRADSCLRLFEILSGMDEPDERALQAAVKDEAFAGHLAVTKNHLYEHLLRSLRAYNSANTTQKRIRTLLDGVEVLFSRGLQQQARQRLHDARELAERYDFLQEQLLIARLESRIDMYTGYAGVTPEQIQQRRMHVRHIMENISNFWDYVHISDIAAYEMSHQGYGGSDVGTRLHEIIHSPQTATAPPSSLQAQQLHRDTLRMYYLMRARYHEGYEHSVQWLRFVESYPMNDRIDQLNYISLLHNHVVLSLKLGRVAEARSTFEKLSALEPRGRWMQWQQKRLGFFCRLDLLMLRLDHEAITGMADDLEAICNGQENGITRQMRMCYAMNLAYAQFANGYLREAACTLHPVINNNKLGVRHDALCVARLMQLMIHYDLGDLELLPYLIRSAYRFITRCRGMFDADRVVLQFMRRLPNMVTQDELIAEFKRVREELAAIASDPVNHEASSLAGILLWVDSKITGRTLSELAREEYGVVEMADTAEHGAGPVNWADNRVEA